MCVGAPMLLSKTGWGRRAVTRGCVIIWVPFSGLCLREAKGTQPVKEVPLCNESPMNSFCQCLFPQEQASGASSSLGAAKAS